MSDVNELDISYQIARQKIIFIGDVNVGKTSIITSLLGKKISDDYEPSVGVDFFSQNIKFKEKQIKLQIWDTAGSEKFRSLIPNYIRGASLIFLVYDIVDKKTFDNLTEWIDFVNQIENTTMIIIGNKLDLEANRAVSFDEAKAFAEENKTDFYEVSAKTGQNLEQMLFMSLSQLSFFNMLNQDNLSPEEICEILRRENSIKSSYNKDNDMKNVVFENNNNLLNMNNNIVGCNETLTQNSQISNGPENTHNIKNEKNKNKKKFKCCN